MQVKNFIFHGLRNLFILWFFLSLLGLYIQDVLSLLTLLQPNGLQTSITRPVTSLLCELQNLCTILNINSTDNNEFDPFVTEAQEEAFKTYMDTVIGKVNHSEIMPTVIRFLTALLTGFGLVFFATKGKLSEFILSIIFAFLILTSFLATNFALEKIFEFQSEIERLGNDYSSKVTMVIELFEDKLHELLSMLGLIIGVASSKSNIISKNNSNEKSNSSEGDNK